MKDNRTKDEIISQYEQLLLESNRKNDSLFSANLQLAEMDKNLRNTIDRVKEDLSKEQKENWDLRSKIKNKESEIRNIRLTQLSQMEAVKMLFDLMASGHTHRSKEMFVIHAKMVIDKQIEEIRRYKFGDENPF